MLKSGSISTKLTHFAIAHSSPEVAIMTLLQGCSLSWPDAPYEAGVFAPRLSALSGQFLSSFFRMNENVVRVS